ncbi:MarR family transcriptional regulator [Arsenicicoccus piscis]|uniref:MarR family transcriptional regulator n=1 Tax=Arsenicicoccus piscis TaxID=673954 RepID=A0ABQ6HUT1_9MICO|nr:MarR family transcriptional regulator [Arsenicicoccus piscis]MCH8626765.1 MarR family transcriptional regulator [Arsenicicoccus piscis]GMA21449.1 MarR family transcriptional regulator [Arsenicicoccus piscis]
MEGDRTPARHAFAERLADLAAASGMPRMAGRVLGVLMATDEGRATAAELAEALAASPAAVSGAVRYLEQTRFVRRTRERGSRRDQFVIEDHLMVDYYRQSQALIRSWATVFVDGAAEIGTDTRAGRRLAESGDFFSFIEQEFPKTVDTWMERRERGERTADSERD